MDRAIWVYIETGENGIAETSLEALSEGRRLTEKTDIRLAAVMIGGDPDRFGETVLRHGAGTLYAIECIKSEFFMPAMHAALFAGLIRDYSPDVVLLGGTTFGNDLAVYLAAELQTGLAANCDKLVFSDNGVLEKHRLCHENKVHVVEITPQARPQIVTLEPGIMKITEASKTPHADGLEIVLIHEVDHACIGRTLPIYLSFIPADPKTIDISDAAIIIAGGNGAKDADQFAMILELADCLSGAVGGSRAAVDNGCISRDRQIGQSGKTVAPELMISCGISGAHAHAIGMKESKTIISINIDKNAPIHKMADLGVVGDMHEIIPALIKRLKAVQTIKTQSGQTDQKSD